MRKVVNVGRTEKHEGYFLSSWSSMYERGLCFLLLSDSPDLYEDLSFLYM